MGRNKKRNRSQGYPGSVTPSQEQRQAVADTSPNMAHISPQPQTFQQPVPQYTPGYGQNFNCSQNMQHSQQTPMFTMDM